MQIKVTVTHVQTGKEWVSETAEDATKEEVDQAKEYLKNSIGRLNYLEVGDTILPGNFLRKYCVITVTAEE